jgi:RpiR family carbohydrate utilization transcriptional regulator
MTISKADASLSPLAIIRSRIHGLSRRERAIAEFALKNAEDLLPLSVTVLAARLHVSEATIIRFCQRMGYRGYHEFKICLARDLGRGTPEIYPELELGDNASTVLQKTSRLSMQALQDSLSTLKGSEVEHASRALLKAHTIALFGVGGSGGIALVAQQRLLRLGLPAFACTDTHVLELIGVRLGEHDIAFGITHSGATREIVAALQTAQEHGALTVALTNRADSPVINVSNIVLLTGAAETPLASEAGASRIVQLAAIDALCARIWLLKQHLPRGNGVLSKSGSKNHQLSLKT